MRTNKNIFLDVFAQLAGRFGDLFLYDWKKGSEPIKVFAKSLSGKTFPS